MFLYASDWSTPGNIQRLEKAGFPHSGKLIKIFASETDPKIILDREIKTVEESGAPFNHEYRYSGGRGIWAQEEMEYYLTGHYKLPENIASEARALFRFGNKSNIEIAQLAMNVRNPITQMWHYRHPLDIVDGLDEAANRARHHGLHLDIFTSRSLERISSVFRLENPDNLATKREVIQISREKELPEVSKERS